MIGRGDVLEPTSLYGQLVEFDVLDLQYRSDQPCEEGLQPVCPAATDPATTLLGPEQERWLLGNLDRSSARWNFIAQQVMMTQIDQTPDDALLFYTDDWNGYPAARDRILNHVRDHSVENFVVMTGDVHSAFASDLKDYWFDQSSATLGTEFICTSISAGGPGGEAWFAEAQPNNPHVRYCDPNHGGFHDDRTDSGPIDGKIFPR